MGYVFAVNDVGTGGEFQDIPDDTYDAIVTEAEGPVDGLDYDKKPVRQFIVTFELQPSADQIEYGCEVGATRKWWIVFTHIAESTGVIGDTSRLYAFLTALGYDMTVKQDMDIEDWLGKRCRVLIKHSEAGNPKISEILAPRKKLVKAEAKQPVAAGRAPLASRVQHDEDED